jgi:hypothetical protein
MASFEQQGKREERRMWVELDPMKVSQDSNQLQSLYARGAFGSPSDDAPAPFTDELPSTTRVIKLENLICCVVSL